KTTGSGRRSVDPSWQASTAESLQTTESLFAENHEPFFNGIGQKLPRCFLTGLAIRRDCNSV
ncbi:MAG: hypothetical protein ABSE22_14720, partial [Xanthobacteraceae bacterium]